MVKTSAGLLMYRYVGAELEFFIAHPGGPFFKNKDEGIWSLPKGEVEPNEELLAAAQREFTEETGITPHGPFIELGSVQQRSGKNVYAWAFEGEWNGKLSTTTPVKMEWPIGSHKMISFPEMDRAAFVRADVARKKLNPAQAAFITRLEEHLALIKS